MVLIFILLLNGPIYYALSILSWHKRALSVNLYNKMVIIHCFFGASIFRNYRRRYFGGCNAASLVLLSWKDSYPSFIVICSRCMYCCVHPRKQSPEPRGIGLTDPTLLVRWHSGCLISFSYIHKIYIPPSAKCTPT